MKNEVTELQKQITRHTGRITVSENATYLRRRLADLQKDHAVPGKRKAPSDGTVPLVASMHTDQKAAAYELAGHLKLGVSAIVRIALADLANKTRRGDLAKRITEGA